MNFATTGFYVSSKNSRTPYFSNPLPNLARNYEASPKGAQPLANPILPRVFKEEMSPFQKQTISTMSLNASIAEKDKNQPPQPEGGRSTSLSGVYDLTKRLEKDKKARALSLISKYTRFKNPGRVYDFAQQETIPNLRERLSSTIAVDRPQKADTPSIDNFDLVLK